jgi:hypothetical protein
MSFGRFPRAPAVAAALMLALAPAVQGAVPPVQDPLPACVPSGHGKDYLVGPQPGGLASLEDVPWELLKAGDTVRISYRPQPYAAKFLLKGSGTKDAPIRVCGIRGPGGERPVITGENATTRRKLVFGSPSAGPIHESRAVIIVKGDERDYRHAPSYIIIDGLALRGAHPSHTFIDAAGATRNYQSFGACLWVERGADITISDNELSDCSQGLFTRSIDDPASAGASISRNILISRNYIHDNGIVGSDRLHNSYVQSVNVVYEFNRYGPPRPGALGNALKDRSVAPVIRFNRIEEGAHALDLVEAEDYSATAMADPAYGHAYVYGNQIIKNGETGSFVHFGGDHIGSNPGDGWGERFFPKGPLYFFHNTIVVRGKGGRIFQISTTQQSVGAWNNIFYFAPTVKYPSLRQSSDVGTSWTPGGQLVLGTNWINAGWADGDPWHPVRGKVTGVESMITGASAPMDLATLVPVDHGRAIDAAQPAPDAASTIRVDWQLDAQGRPVPRVVHGKAPDLGAVER